ARGERRLHAGVTHGDAIGDRDGAELARGAVGGGDAFLDRLGLAHQRDVAGGGLVPAGGHADERLVDLLGRQTHGVIIGAVWRPLRAFGHTPAWQPVFEVGLRVHRLRSAA